MIKLAISGCCGRMGAKIATLATQDPDLSVTALFERSDNPNIGKDFGEFLGVGKKDIAILSNADEAIKKSDVVIDFTAPEATTKNIESAVKNKKAMVIGTTAIDQDGVKIIKEASKRIPIVFSPNMSVGVNLLFNLMKEASGILKDYNVTMSEAHHKHKKDAPSGTAKKLAQIIKDVKGECDIPIDSIREGEIIGDHTVIFDGEFERLAFSHHAKSRDVFASGALVAAKFVAGKKSGFFTMQDVLK